MRNSVKKLLACVLVLTLALSVSSGAFAATYPSGEFRLPTVVHRPTAEPTAEPTEEPTAEPTAEPTEEPTAEPTVEPTAEPTAEPTEEPEAEPTEKPAAQPTEAPAEEPEFYPYSYQRDESGALLLDENGDPIAIVPEGVDIPVAFQRDENGALVLDENGDPIVLQTVPAGSDKLTSIYDVLDPNRRIDIYMTWDGEPALGASVTLTAALTGYDAVTYTLQWQVSTDDQNWQDVPGAVDAQYTVQITEENYMNYWRVLVVMEEFQ